MKIELLYFDGCASWQTALENLISILQEEGITESVNVMEIMNDERAQKEEFLGSPSIRINGLDLWSEQRENYSLSCRVYATPEGIKGWPTVEMLRSKIKLTASS